jgi:hypothetical protein
MKKQLYRVTVTFDFLAYAETQEAAANDFVGDALFNTRASEVEAEATPISDPSELGWRTFESEVYHDGPDVLTAGMALYPQDPDNP